MDQLNFSGRKYKPHEVETVLKAPSTRKFVLRCSDRYGAYGTIGFAVASWNGPRAEIQDFMLSCRVQGKFLEQAFFRHLIEQHCPDARTLWLNFRRTDRNTPALEVLTTLGFADDPAGGMAMELPRPIRWRAISSTSVARAARSCKPASSAMKRAPPLRPAQPKLARGRNEALELRHPSMPQPSQVMFSERDRQKCLDL